jgi:hypothetical protein
MLRQRYIKGLLIAAVIPLADIVLSPITLLAALWLKLIRRVGVYRMKVSRAVFNRVGVFPIRDHYYEPAFNPRHLREPLSHDRYLPGVDLDLDGQLALLSRFDYVWELDSLPRKAAGPCVFYYDNPNFPPGDSEYLYSIISPIQASANPGGRQWILDSHDAESDRGELSRGTLTLL